MKNTLYLSIFNIMSEMAAQLQPNQQDTFVVGKAGIPYQGHTVYADPGILAIGYHSLRDGNGQFPGVEI